MTIAQFRFTRGETITLALEAVEGDVTGFTCTADLKLAVNGLPPGDGADIAAAFDVVDVAEVTPDGGPGWILTIEADVAEALVRGVYVADARLELASGFVEQADPIRIDLRERVTA